MKVKAVHLLGQQRLNTADLKSEAPFREFQSPLREILMIGLVPGVTARLPKIRREMVGWSKPFIVTVERCHVSFPAFRSRLGLSAEGERGPIFYFLSYTCSMKRESVLFLVVGVVVAIVTISFIFSSEPEELKVSSSDGVVTVTGLARQTQTLEVLGGPGVKEPLLGPSYDILPADLVLDLPVTVTFKLDPLKNNANIKLYRYNENLLMWEMIDKELLRDDERVAVEAPALGRFALGTREDFAAPVFASTYDDLKNLAPEQAVGYEILVGYTEDKHETVRLTGQGEVGGCGGLAQASDGQEQSRLEREVNVGDDEDRRLITFVFMATWFTSSQGGCEADQALSPKLGYGMLQEN